MRILTKNIVQKLKELKSDQIVFFPAKRRSDCTESESIGGEHKHHINSHLGPVNCTVEMQSYCSKRREGSEWQIGWPNWSRPVKWGIHCNGILGNGILLKSQKKHFCTFWNILIVPLNHTSGVFYLNNCMFFNVHPWNCLKHCIARMPILFGCI